MNNEELYYDDHHLKNGNYATPDGNNVATAGNDNEIDENGENDSAEELYKDDQMEQQNGDGNTARPVENNIEDNEDTDDSVDDMFANAMYIFHYIFISNLVV